MRFKLSKKWLAISLGALVLIGGAGGYLWYTKAANGTTPAASLAGQAASTIDLDNGDEDIDWEALPTTNVTLGNSALNITTAGTYVLTGTTTAGITVNTDGNVRLALNGATIRSTDGAAVSIQSANNTIIQLVDGTQNIIEDAATRVDQSIDAAIYSADDLTFNGSGTLTVRANFADAIASSDDLKFSSGTYNITSVDDGLRGRDSVYIKDGTFTVEASGDAVKATNDTDAAKGYVYVQGGNLTITAGDDAIHAEEKVVVENTTILIKDSVEGIEGSTVTIESGTITLYASDDGINAPGSNFSAAAITINGGTLNVTVGQGDTDAIDANGDIYLNGGSVTIIAPTSSFDYDGTAQMNGGTLVVNGQQLTAIPTPTMGGGPMR